MAGFVPLVARPVLRLAADAFDQLQVGVLFGSFTAVLVLFSVPVTLLGMISPFAIRLAISDPQAAGRVSGRIYAISTLGSFVGTFLPVLVFIPLIGTTWTFFVFSEFLLLVALAGHGAVRRAGSSRCGWPGWRCCCRYWRCCSPAARSRAPPGRSTRASRPTTTSRCWKSRTGTRVLRLNEGQGEHSM